MIYAVHRVLISKAGNVASDSIVYERADSMEPVQAFHERWVAFSEKQGRTYTYEFVAEWVDGDPEGEKELAKWEAYLEETEI